MGYPAPSFPLPSSVREFDARERVRFSVHARALLALTKPRLAAMSVITAAVGYHARPHSPSLNVFLALMLGTTLSAAGALALNQWCERDTDRLMERTRSRPLPSGELSAPLALTWSLALGVAGVAALAIQVNLLAAALSAATILLYAFVYTPLKRRTRWATEIGAIPGALPPLIGCAAAEGGLTIGAAVLFAILFFWQMPHFFAIGWKCRDDYRAAGFPLLPAIDADGARTAAWSLAHTVALVAASLLPCWRGDAGFVYASIALVAGAGMLFCAVRFFTARNDRLMAAKRLFRASLIYLPVVLAALAFAR